MEQKFLKLDGISTKEARLHFTEILGHAEYAKERVLLTRRGKPIAYVVPIEDVQLLERLENEIDRPLIETAWQEYQQGKYQTLEEVKKKLR